MPVLTVSVRGVDKRNKLRHCAVLRSDVTVVNNVHVAVGASRRAVDGAEADGGHAELLQVT